MAKKTIKKWKKSELEWDDYFKSGDEIDEETFLHIAESVPAEFDDKNFVQCGEASSTKINSYDKRDVYYHSTAFGANDGKYYYLGDLPTFNND